MSGMLVLALLALPPTRLVIGTDKPDLRRTGAENHVTRLLEVSRGVEVRRLPFALVVDVPDAAAARRALRKLPGVRWVEPEVFFPVALRAVPDDPHYPQQWHLHDSPLAVPQADIDVEAAWDLTRGLDSAGVPVRVGVIDDGFDLAHEDLAARYAPIGFDNSGDLNDDDPSPGAFDNHGTHTAGTIAATGFNGLGVSGVCPACELLPVRLIGNGGPGDLYSSGSAAAEAVTWAVDNGAAVINNSWGPPDGNRFDPTHPVSTWELPLVLADALRYAVTQGRGGLGSVITWSAGNGAELVTYDGYASDPRVVAVGAIDSRGVQAFYSDFGPPIRLVAPSSGLFELPRIWTTDRSGTDGLDPGDYYADYSGTSAAGAVVAGVVALVMAEHGSLTGPQVMEALFDSALRIDPARGQYVNGRSSLYGYGRVAAATALAAAATYTDGCTHWLDLCGNGRDDNCDGQIDDPNACTSCTPDAPRELCDGYDNNCDGNIDELFVCEGSDRPVCAPCDSSTQCAIGSRCRASFDFPGTWCFAECLDGSSCAPGFTCDGEVCLLEVTPPDPLSCFDMLRCGQAERCDGLDNDCNERIDDVEPDSVEAQVATRECGREGVCAERAAVCAFGTWWCDRADTWQAEESLCDGLDNDCDGAIDEAPICEARLQRLRGAGHGTCAAGGTWLAAVIGALLVRRRRRGARSRSASTCWLTRK